MTTATATLFKEALAGIYGQLCHGQQKSTAARWPETRTQEIILTKPNPSQVTKKKHLRRSNKLNINKHAGRSKRGASTKSIIIKRNNSYLSLGGKEERDFVQKPMHPLHCSRLRLLRHQFHYYLQHHRNRRLASQLPSSF